MRDEKKDQGASLLPADPISGVQTETRPDYICKRCGGTRPTCCSCPSESDRLNAESRMVRDMLKAGDTQGIADYVNRGNHARAKAAAARRVSASVMKDKADE